MAQKKEITIQFPTLNKLINDTFIPLWSCEDRYMILYGSRGSSKSDFAAKLVIRRMLEHSFFRCICIRNTEASIGMSVFNNLKMNISKMGISHLFKINESPMKIECLLNKNLIVFKGMDNPDKIKSISEITCIWWEEDINYDYDDYITVTTSMRAPKADFIQEIFTINPVLPDYENHWFWKKFFEGHDELSYRIRFELEYDGKKMEQFATVHNSTWRDNKWLKSDFIHDIEQLRDTDPYLYSVFNLGIWTQSVAKGQFWKNFTLARNSTDNIPYNKELPLHLSFDFNNNPYMTCTVYQVDGKIVKQINEICLRTPRNKTKEVCEDIKNLYRGHESGMFIYGDPNGYKEDTKSEKGYNDYKIIFSELSIFRPTDRTTRSYPSVKMSGMFINEVFQSNYADISVIISRKCRNSINDFTTVKEAPDGTMLKEKAIDKETGVNCEKGGHCFVGDTMIKTIDGYKRIDEITIEDCVLTREGYKRVLNNHDNGYRTVKTYSIDDKKITCTPNHKIYTEEHDFVEAQYLDESEANTFIIFDKTENKWKKKLSRLMDINLQDTQKQKQNVQGIIIQDGQLEMVSEGKIDYIGTYGGKLMEKFQINIIYIIKTVILLIMNFLIWFVSKARNILEIIIKNLQKKANKKRQIFLLLKLLKLRNYGINQMKDENGIDKWLLNVAQSLLVLKNVLNVRKNLMSQRINQIKNTVGIFVQDEYHNVEQEKEIKQRVYDLTVEDCHEYFANDILVHNCSDSFRYMMARCFENEYNLFKNAGSANVYVQSPRRSKNSW